jgi:hypothetical protein
MSDNKLLTEGTIRRFMKLANVETLTDSFISEMASYKTKAADGKNQAGRAKETDAERKAREQTTAEAQEEEETLEEQEEPMDDEPMDDEPMDDEPMDDEPMDDEPMDAEPEMGAADISLTEEEAQLLIDLGERLKEAMGDDMDMDVDMGDDDMDMDDDMDLDAGDDDDAGYGGERPMMEDEDRDEIVQEVLRRVTKRIVSAARK